MKHKPYEPSKIEKKWQKYWEKKKIYKTEDPASSKTPRGRKKFYVLDMFPYPSGEGLHVGHPKGYIATDIISRMKRMQGHNVLHPMGFDAFGLPAENYAIKTKTNPEIAVKKNVARYKKQLEMIGFDYDWSREVNTTDPKFYKWTQWIFLQLLKKGLAYESNEPVNWCPTDKTVLANEDVEDGKCERCGSVVEKRPMRQWVLKITDYAERLLEDLDSATSEDGTASVTAYKGAPLFTQIVEPGLVKPKLPFVERNAICAIVKHWSEDKYIGLKWKKIAWKTLLTGGPEGDQTPEEVVAREIKEETGYKNIKKIKNLGKFHSKFFHPPKNVNRFGHFDILYVELENGERKKLSKEEAGIHEVVWLTKEEMPKFLTPASHKYAWQKFLNPEIKGVPGAKALLDWPEHIKESQRNWIGRSEGTEIEFPTRLPDGQVSNLQFSIKVFTTRVDTIFGATYLVLAPEHEIISKTKSQISNFKEVEKYLNKTKSKTEIERAEVGKEKTGVELKGIKAVNPATGEEIPVWVADYVLAHYGTGAVMAVPAHDERDFQFAKKYDLPIKEVIRPSIVDHVNPPQTDKPTKTRNNVHAIVYNPVNKKYLILKNDKFGWNTVIIGGIEEGEDHLQAALRELKEETGYVDLEFKRILGNPVQAAYFAKHKNENRIAIATGLYFELKSDKKVNVATDGDNEGNEIKWIDAKEFIPGIMVNSELPQWLERIHAGKEIAYTSEGILVNSGEFSEMSSEKAREKMTEKFGKKVVKYKLRDWVFSRQRYWGEPIPVFHDENGERLPVAEKDLPVILPKVKFYEPTGTGESPLANIKNWVNVRKGKRILKRETNTMPQWAGSSWYYLRYMDPKNSKKLVDSRKEKYWNQVDFYVGGAEHATRHLIYARFWHKFLFDIGVAKTKEPFKKLQSVGLIMAEDGRKMSKRFGNVINPDDIIKTWGADTLRLYEMFMGPFADAIAWNTNNMIGVRRFLEKVWRLQSKVHNVKSPKLSDFTTLRLETIVHKTIKKVTEDIEDMKFNTAISTLMVCLNDLEKEAELSKSVFDIFLRLLAPFAPHMTEELWSNLGGRGSIHQSDWPEYNERKVVEEKVVIIVQVNGRMRGQIDAENGISEQDAKNMALNKDEIKKWLTGMQVRKVIWVPNKVLNFVIV